MKLFDQLVIEGSKFRGKLYLTAILLDFMSNVLLSSVSQCYLCRPAPEYSGI